MFEQDFGAGAQVAHLRFRQVEGGADVEYALFQRAVGQIVQVKVDVVQRRACSRVALLVPFVGEALEIADALLCVLVDGDVDDGGGDVAQAGDVRALVDGAVEAVLCIDADDDDVADIAVGDACAQGVAVDVAVVEDAVQAEVVGEAAVQQVNVRAGGAVLIRRGVACGGVAAPCANGGGA